MLSRKVFFATVSGFVLIGSNPVHAQSSNVIALDAITVTTNKREQQLEKVDRGVSVATATDLQEKNVRTIEDLQKVFPSLVIDNRGNRAYANFTVRGISSPDYYSPSVQVYVDGVPQAPSAMVQDLVDVERVEFLRGPQGTLYGRNAVGGVINIITKQARTPTSTVFGTVANRLFEGGLTTTGVLIPDTLFMDLAVKGSRRLGQIKDTDGSNDRIDGWDGGSGRAALRYAPTGGPFDANVWVSHEALRSHEETFILDQDVGKRLYRSPILSAYGPYNVFERHITTTGVSWNYRFDDFTLSNSTSFQSVDMKRKLFGVGYPETDHSLTEELRLAYDGGGRVKGVVGLSYWNDWFTRDDDGYPGYYGRSRNKVESRSAAVFGEMSYAFTERLELTAGARGAYDWAAINFNRPDSYGNGSGFGFDQTADFSSFQPKVSLGYQITDTTRVYGLISEGYKPGGFNHAVSYPQDAEAYRPEKAWNYEAGLRTALFGGRLSLTTALYHIASNDKQIYVGPAGLQVIRNAGKGESNGVELSAMLKPTDQLTLNATANFGRSEFTDLVDPLSGVSYTGNRVPYAPDQTANLSARYIVGQTFFPGQIAVTGATRLVGKTYFDVANTLSQPAFATYDAGLEFAFDKGLTVKIFADNIADKVYRTASFNYGGTIISTIGLGRLVGASMQMKF